jgi:CRP/FNR family transcriptional regulator, cyclic AMP receptor protein
MISRFEGASGRRLRVEAIAGQKLVGGNVALAEEIADRVSLVALSKGQNLIEQDDEGNELYLIFSGVFDVIVNGRIIGKRGPYDHLGEMAAIQPIQKRSATLTATEDAVVARLSESDFHELGSRHPEMYRQIARELARRLMQRNALINAYHETIRVFIISSAEALPIARIIQNAFQHDPFLTKVWTDGVFRVANYTLQDLEAEIDSSDFAIAIAHSDDLTESRGKDWPSPRDNVIFELGLFMGRLGRARAVLMEPREDRVKLPSDLSGVTTIAYRFEKGADATAFLAPACNALRSHILALGPNN